MRLVSRHILSALAGPFVWGLVALTGLLLLQQLAPLIDKFGGHGLPLSVIGEAFLLTLPALLALSLPMAVLVATLYGYSQLAGDLELVAMYANGISVWRMARPALVAAIFVAVVNFFLYDQLVPRSNFKYNKLQTAVFQSSPTLTFQPGVMNPLNPAAYVLLATRIDPDSSKLREVTLYDLGAYGTTRIIHADSGVMALSPSGVDLLLDLDHGTIDEFRKFESGRFQRTAFEHNQWRIRDVVTKLNIAAGGNARGDRDMTGCELLNETQNQQWYADDQQRQIEFTTRRDLRQLLGLPTLPLPSSSLQPGVPHHCAKFYLRFENWVKGIMLPTKAQAQAPVPQQQVPVKQVPAPQQQVPIQQQPVVAPPAGTTTQGTVPPMLVPPVAQAPQEQALAGRANIEGPVQGLRSSQINALRYRVEYHKKFAIPLASFCFVLLGMSLALKYPRSGIGLVIGASMVIFLGFYILLIGGENVAKQGYLTPFIAIQGPLVLFTLLGLLAVRSANREMGTARTAGIFDAVMDFFNRFRRDRA